MGARKYCFAPVKIARLPLSLVSSEILRYVKVQPKQNIFTFPFQMITAKIPPLRERIVRTSGNLKANEIGSVTRMLSC